MYVLLIGNPSCSCHHNCTDLCIPNWPSCTCTALCMRFYTHILSVHNMYPSLAEALSSVVPRNCLHVAIPSQKEMVVLVASEGSEPKCSHLEILLSWHAVRVLLE